MMKPGASIVSAEKGLYTSAYVGSIKLLNSREISGDILHPLHPYGYSTRVWSRAWEATKSSGGNPPAVGGPPCVEDHLIYATPQPDYPIIANNEHMFSILDKNTCFPYGKAA